jgi:hypothetical protein
VTDVNADQMIRERPNEVEQNAILYTAKNPTAIVRLALKIIFKAGAFQRSHGSIAFAQDHIDVFGVSPATAVYIASASPPANTHWTQARSIASVPTSKTLHCSSGMKMLHAGSGVAPGETGRAGGCISVSGAML